MSKLVIKKKFKHDIVSESETELLNKNNSEFSANDKVTVKYFCDQFDFESIISEFEKGNLALDVNSLKSSNK